MADQARLPVTGLASMRSSHRFAISVTMRRCSCSPGKPVGIFRTHSMAPRVLIANSNLVPAWANAAYFRDLEAKGLIMYGQMTAGSWIYIGTQGILQGTYETFAEIARRHFGGTLAGRFVLTAGLGGMGGAQPLSVTMNEGVALVVEVDPSRIARRIETRYVDRQTTDSTRRCAGSTMRSARKRPSRSVCWQRLRGPCRNSCGAASGPTS